MQTITTNNAVKNIKLNDFTIIVGKNNSGKTRFLKTLSEHYDKGQGVSFWEQPVFYNFNSKIPNGLAMFYCNELQEETIKGNIRNAIKQFECLDTVELDFSIAAFRAEKVGLRAIVQQQLSSSQERIICFIIKLNNFLFDKDSKIWVIDDLGDGLDWSSQLTLIKYLQNALGNTSKKVVASSTHQFIINNVSLNDICILERAENNNTRLYSYHNSKSQYQEFKFIGLNNFDFWSRCFYKLDIKTKVIYKK